MRSKLPFLVLAGTLALLGATPVGVPAPPPVPRPVPVHTVPPQRDPGEGGEAENHLSTTVRALAPHDRGLFETLGATRPSQPTYALGVKIGGSPANAAVPVRPHRAPATLHDTSSFDRPGVANRVGKLTVLCLLENGNVSAGPGSPSVCGAVPRLLRIDRATGKITATVTPPPATATLRPVPTRQPVRTPKGTLPP